MKLFKYIFILFFVICFSSNHLFSQDLVTDRPDQTESSVTVPLGKFQIESGFLFGSSGKSPFKIKSLVFPSTLFRYGITHGIELRIVNQFEKIKDDNQTMKGMNDLEIGTKFQILKNENINTEIAFLSHLIIPSGSDKFKSDKFGTVNKLAISHSLSDKIGLGYNVGYNYFGEGKGDFVYSAAVGISLSKQISIFFEPYGEFIEFDELQASFDSGLTYLLKDNFQLDFSVGFGLNHEMSYLGAGFSWII